MLRSEAIAKILNERSKPDLAAAYKPGMEVQVNVGQFGGTRITKEIGERRYPVWTNNEQTEEWANYRIPRDANTEAPKDNDVDIRFNHDKYVEAIGLSGWNYKDQVSEFFGFDFDSINGHSSGLTEAELKQVRNAACAIPWITVRRSTSGTGLHLYIHLSKPFPTKNHTEHAAVARSLLSKMMSVTGYLFEGKVDVCGHIMWWWHRKMIGTDGLSLVKQGELFDTELIPSNWRDHINVVSGKAKKIKSKRSNGFDIDELLKQKTKTGLDEMHMKIISNLEGSSSYWDSDNHILVTHTAMLKKMHTDDGLTGYFETDATGKDCPNDINCFCFPMSNGAFNVYRFGPGTKEHKSWRQDGRGWSYTFFNRHPDLMTIMDAFEGIKTEKKDYVFKQAFQAMDALSAIGVDIGLEPYMHKREARIREDKDGQIIVKVAAITGEDNAEDMASWELGKDRYFTKIFRAAKKAPKEAPYATYDDHVRHIVSTEGNDMGWMLRTSGNQWNLEAPQNVRLYMKFLGLKADEIDFALGWAISNPWRVIGRPFEDEYPGGRDWNRNAAQYAFEFASPDKELIHPTWDMIFEHLGEGLNQAVIDDEWCTHNQVYTGADYLKLWVASMMQQPNQPTPYLFFWGEQNTGKSVFHEAISMLLTSGVVDGDKAMRSQGDFNGELLNSVLCYVEETHLGRDKKAYARLKNWVTAINMSIHVKGLTPFMVPNTTHWCQFANEQDACPVFTGDKRITYVYVAPLDKEIPKKLLLNKLREEASDFLTQIVMRTEIPDTNGRLNIPTIKTTDMEEVQLANETALERFLREKCFYAPGELILISDFYDKFKTWIHGNDPEEYLKWSSPNKVTRNIGVSFSKVFGRRFHKGRSTIHDSAHAYGNISFEHSDKTGIVYISDGKFLRKTELSEVEGTSSFKTEPLDDRAFGE